MSGDKDKGTGDGNRSQWAGKDKSRHVRWFRQSWRFRREISSFRFAVGCSPCEIRMQKQ